MAEGAKGPLGGRGIEVGAISGARSSGKRGYHARIVAASPSSHEDLSELVSRMARRRPWEPWLTLDALFTFRFPEEYQERMIHLMNSFLLSNTAQVSGLSKVRRLKVFWDKSRERILKKNPYARGEIVAVGQKIQRLSRVGGDPLLGSGVSGKAG